MYICIAHTSYLIFCIRRTVKENAELHSLSALSLLEMQCNVSLDLLSGILQELNLRVIVWSKMNSWRIDGCVSAHLFYIIFCIFIIFFCAAILLFPPHIIYHLFCCCHNLNPNMISKVLPLSNSKEKNYVGTWWHYQNKTVTTTTTIRVSVCIRKEWTTFTNVNHINNYR